MLYDPDGTGKVWGWDSWIDGVTDWAGHNNNDPELTTINGGTTISNYAEAWEGHLGMMHSDKTGSSYQRVKLEFVASGETAKITLSASGDDTGDLWFDDVRVTPTLTGRLREQKGHTYYEDFENVDELYGPFAPYNKERYIATDNTHLSQLNPGVTDDVIDGNYSLKVTAGTSGSGNTIRTLPHHVRFKGNTEYTVGFAFNPYNCSSPVVLQVMSGDGTVLFSENITGEGEKSFTFTTGNTDDYYI